MFQFSGKHFQGMSDLFYKLTAQIFNSIFEIQMSLVKTCTFGGTKT